jgi:hypothetical protein
MKSSEPEEDEKAAKEIPGVWLLAFFVVWTALVMTATAMFCEKPTSTTEPLPPGFQKKPLLDGDGNVVGWYQTIKVEPYTFQNPQPYPQTDVP